jgi:hypothetical protein
MRNGFDSPPIANRPRRERQEMKKKRWLKHLILLTALVAFYLVLYGCLRSRFFIVSMGAFIILFLIPFALMVRNSNKSDSN